MSALMLDGDLERWIIKLISEQSGVNVEQISLQTRLNHDLGIGGDDASELLELYAEAFSVDMNDFQFHKYFQDEPHLLNFWRYGSGSSMTTVARFTSSSEVARDGEIAI